jgi:proteic killer suppression protein
MIRSFRDRVTEALFNGEITKGFAQVAKVARRKLRAIHYATRLDDLHIPPANRLEALKGGRKGQYSIRINDQYRICFRWTPHGAEDVEVVDYH